MRKLIITNQIIEIYDTERNIVGVGGYKEPENLEQKDKNYNQQILKRRNNVRRLLCCNFTDKDKFFTLTFANNETDIKKCDNEFKKFVKRLKYTYNLKDFKYLAVIEFQERGAIHYHIICNLPYVPHKELQELWGNGIVWINCIQNADNVGAYVVKYMTKDTADKRLQNHKGYLCSKGLKRPIEVSNVQNTNRDVFQFYNNLITEKTKKVAPVFTSEYENEFLGKVLYKQYNFNRQ